MKRKLALFMVLAMLISLVPMNVFAASTNTVLVAPTVAKNDIITSKMRFAEPSTGEWQQNSRTFELELTNGEWQNTMNAAAANYSQSGAGGVGDFTVVKNTSKYATVTMRTTTATSGDNKFWFDVTMPIKATGGEVTVKVNPRDSHVTGGTYVVGNAVAGATKTTIADVNSFADTVTLETVKIDEVTINSLSDTAPQTIKLKLNAGFEWASNSATFTTAGGWNAFPTATVVAGTIDSGDARILTMPAITPGAGGDQRGTFYIAGLQVKRTSDAKIGDVNMTISSTSTGTNDTITEETVTVAKYVTYDVTVKAVDEPREIYAGQYEGVGGADNAHKLTKLNIKEEVTNSWLANRITKIQFNDEVKILGFRVTENKDVNITGGAIKTDAGSFGLNGGNAYQATHVTNRNYIEITNATIAPNQKANVEIEFFVSVKANYTGDITATVSGTALSQESKVVLGKAVAPAKITAQLKDLRLGLQNQLIGDVVITEPAKGVWEGAADGTKELVLSFGSQIGQAIRWNNEGTIAVTKGDVTLGQYKDAGVIPIKYSSTVASEITIKGMSIDVNRTLPEGKYSIRVGGDAIVRNDNADQTNGRFDQSTSSSAEAFNIITPADGNTTTIQKVVFTIDSMEYMVGDAKVTSDVAPFINEQGRTMLPLRAFANALNVSNDNIIWNEAERSVVVFKGESTVKVKIGEMQFQKNGVTIPMDTMAIIKDGRTMLPLRAVAQALGAVITWDEATRTVTVQ